VTKSVVKNLITIGFLILSFGLLWLLNQKKNFNPVLSFHTNLSFKSKKNINYSEYSSTIEILKILQKKDSSFNLKPTMKEILPEIPNENKQFTELGRVITNNQETIIVYEYANRSKASVEFNRLKDFYNVKNVLYKNIIISFSNESSTIKFLKDELK